MEQKTSSKEYYSQMIMEQQRILKKARSMMETLLDKITKEIIEATPQQGQELQSKYPDGKMLDALSRSVQCLLKLIPLEEKTAKLAIELEEDKTTHTESEELSDADLKIIEHYIEARKRDAEYEQIAA